MHTRPEAISIVPGVLILTPLSLLEVRSGLLLTHWRENSGSEAIKRERLRLGESGYTRMSADVPAPNFVLDTSPGKYQVVWKVGGLNQDEAESLLRGLANQFGGDPAATDATRVLRLRGFVNRKLSEQFVVQARQGCRRPAPN